MVVRTILVAAALALVIAAGACSPVERNFGGTGGSGGGALCKMGDKVACYDGAAATKDVGICKAGMKVCGPSGTFGACEGQVLPATEDCKTPDDEDCNGTAEVCPLTTLWAGAYGKSGNNNVGNAVAVGDKGAIVAVGAFNGIIDFGSGELKSAEADDIWVARFDPMGTVLWAKSYGGPGYQHASAVALDAMGNIYVAGSFEGTTDFGGPALLATSAGASDAFILKLSPAGDTQWVVTGGDMASQEATALAVDAAGQVFVAGTFSGSFAFPGGPMHTATAGGTDVFLVKLGSDGKALFGTNSGGAGSQGITTMAVDPQGDLFFPVRFNQTLTFNTSIHPAVGNDDIYLTKVNGKTGGLIWEQSFGGMGSDGPSGVASDSKGDVILAGVFAQTMPLDTNITLTALGEESVFLAALSGGTGAPLWAKPFGSCAAGNNRALVAVDAKGDIALGGYYNGTIDFGGGPLISMGMGFGVIDLFLAKFDPAGGHLASRRIGNAFLQVSQAVAVDPNDHIVMTGGLQGPLDFGLGELGPADPMATSPFLAKFAP